MKLLKRFIKSYISEKSYIYRIMKKIYYNVKVQSNRILTVYYARYRKRDAIYALARGMCCSYRESEVLLQQGERRKHIAFLITEYDEINNTGDKYSAISMGEKLKEVDPRILISYYVRDPRIEWRNVHPSVDYIIVMDPETDFKVIKSLSSVKIAWVRGNYNRWLENGNIQQYEAYVVSSPILARQFDQAGIDRRLNQIINLGIPVDVQRALLSKGNRASERTQDVVFIGNIYHIERDIVRNLVLNQSFKFNFYGNITQTNHPWQPYNKGNLPHEQIHKVYLDSKIVIEDIAPFNKGTVNLRVFEAAACGALVIANYDEALEMMFGDAIEFYTTKEELNYKIQYYLNHNYKRECRAKLLQKLVLDKYTFLEEANKLYKELYIKG